MKKILIALSLVLVGVVAAEAAKIAAVKAVSADGRDENVGDVLARCRLKAGAEYDAQQCARDVRELRDSGEFDEITANVEEGADGLIVTYSFRRKMRFLAPLNVKGNDYWGVGKITKLAELKDGYAYGEADFAAAAGRIRKEYQKKFFPEAKVTPVVEPIPGSPGAVTVTMVIEEGARHKISDYTFDGNASIDGDDLRASIDQYPWWNPLGWFSDDPATEQDFAEACDKIADCYRDRGFLDVSVAMPEEIALPNGKYERRFKIDEGARYTIGTMCVTGVTKYPADAVLGAVKAVKIGDVAGAAALTEAAHQVEIFCGSGPFALAETRVNVKRMPQASDSSVLDIEFAVVEGVPVTISRVLVRGNDYTKDKVIRREILLSPGDPMLEDKADRSKRRLENLRYFERVRYYLEKTETGDPKPGEPELRDLVYEVAEKNTGNFMVGIGASSVDSVYGTVELSESNFDLFSPWRFRGAGQKGRIYLAAGPRYQSYEASVTEPHLFDRLLELTVEGYRRQRWFDEYDIIRNGAAVTLSYPVKFWPTWRTFGRLGTRISAEYIQFDDVEKGIWYDRNNKVCSFKEEEEKYGDAWEVPFRLFWQNDTRDEFLFPKKGHRVNLYGDLVTGDNEYWRLGFNYKQYWTVWKKYSHVLSFGLRGETVDTFSGSDRLPIYDRLFLGGPRSIRGVEYRDIAPRVWKRQNKKGSYEPWGGQTSWCGTFEYTVPIVKYVRVAAFTDFGSVGEDEFDFDNDWFCWSVGFGLRLDIEQFPIRLDFAVPVVEPDDDADKEFFSFSIGYDF